MSRRIHELFLFDTYIAILKIEEVASRYTQAEDLKYDFMAWDSVMREFEIVGESTNVLIKNHFLAKENQIIVDFRNLLIYHYFGIDAEEVWDVIKNDLANFKTTVIVTISKIEKTLKEELIAAMQDENKHLGFVKDGLKMLAK
jgi:uncharacterized protein with HEPN domain